MQSEQNKNAVRRLIERGFNGKELSEFDRYFASGVITHHLPPGLAEGVEGIKQLFAGFLNAFPDLTLTIDDLLAEDDSTVLRWTARGTHRGDLMGIPPSGRSIQITGIAIDRYEKGRSVEHWEQFDQMGMLQQIGAIPTPEAAG